MKARLVVATIEMAVARRDGELAGCIFHSDRGSQAYLGPDLGLTITDPLFDLS
jgi:hypothetical protein